MCVERLSLFPSSARVDEAGRLWLGGCLARDLAERFGTPLYVYDEATLRGRCREAQAALCEYPSRVFVTYASKAFLCLGLAQLLRQEEMGLDVVSGGELAVARAAGFSPERVHLHGNNKSRSELVAAVEWGVGTIVVDGFHELSLLRQLVAGRPIPQRVWLRINPGIDVHAHAANRTGALDSKFGFTLENGEAAAALQQARAIPGLQVVGLHAHIGSQIFEPEPFAEAIHALLDLAAAQGFVPQEISPGGGWSSALNPNEAKVPFTSYAKTIANATVTGCTRHGFPLPTIVVELGRAIVAPAGVALYTVGGRKEIPGVRTYVAIDGGMGDNARPALYGAQYTALAVDAATAPPSETVTLAGRYCEAGDILIQDVALPRVQPGDLLAVPQAGAYCLSLASNYNLVPRPAVVLVGEGRARLLRRRETVDDLMARDLPLEEIVS